MTDDQKPNQLKFPTNSVPTIRPAEQVASKPENLSDLSVDDLRQTTHKTQATVQPGTKPGRHLATQTQYPWRTAIRSGFGVFGLFLVAAAAASPIIGPFVDRYVPGAGAGIIAFGLFCGSLTILIKRIGSIPAVAALFVRLGIGVVPKSALKS